MFEVGDVASRRVQPGGLSMRAEIHAVALRQGGTTFAQRWSWRTRVDEQSPPILDSRLLPLFPITRQLSLSYRNRNGHEPNHRTAVA